MEFAGRLAAPRVSSQESMIVEFMENMGHRLHPAIPGGLAYDFGTAHWKRPELPSDLQPLTSGFQQLYSKSIEAHGSLTEVLNKYMKKTNQQPLDLSNECTWGALRARMDQVSLSLQGTLDRRREASNFPGKLRKVLGALCESAAAGKVFTSVIPSELSLASAICGGLNVIFSAMEQKALHERSVCDAIEQLPAILRTHAKFAEAAAHDVQVHQETDGLYVAVCGVLQHVVEWLIENTFKSTVKHLFTPKRYVEKLGELMAKLRCASQRLDACATAIILQAQKQCLDIHSTSLSLQERISRGQGELRHQMDSMDDSMQQNLQAHGERLQRIEQLQSLQLCLQMEVASIIACENLQPFLRDSLQGLYTAKQKSLYGPKPGLTAERFLRNVNYDASLVDNDLRLLLLHLRIPSMQHRLQNDRVDAIQKSSRLRAWLSVDRSTVLQVNSNADTRSDLSASFVMAKLVNSLLAQAEHSSAGLEIVALAYFCGQHGNSYVDPAATATALAEGLLAQLVDQHRDFDERDVREGWDHIERSRSVGDTMQVLGQMIDCMPTKSMVFIVIDGLEAFQTPPQRKQETREVLDHLEGIFRRSEHGPGPKIKLLFSTCTACHLLEGLLHEEDVVTIPKTPRPGGPLGKVMGMTLL